MRYLEFYLVIEVNLELRPAGFAIQAVAFLHERYAVLVRLRQISRRETDHLKLKGKIFPVIRLKGLQSVLQIIHNARAQNVKYVHRVNRVLNSWGLLRLSLKS